MVGKLESGVTSQRIVRGWSDGRRCSHQPIQEKKIVV
jgi:hypothetical protein